MRRHELQRCLNNCGPLRGARNDFSGWPAASNCEVRTGSGGGGRTEGPNSKANPRRLTTLLATAGEIAGKVMARRSCGP
jgi:hypothetical protein